MKFILDTNVVSEATRTPPDAGVLKWLASLDEDETYLSVVTIAEIRQGIETMAKGKRRDAIWTWYKAGLLARFDKRIIEVSVAIAETWALMAAAAQANGRPMAIMDGFVAATARTHSMVVATRNVRDFESLGVKILNPWDFK
jgi:predicted nucleic acid-binding protein